MSEEKNPFEVCMEPVARDIVDLSGEEALNSFASSVPRTSLDEALEIVKAHLDSGKGFSNAQIDICTEVVATQLPGGDKDMLHEIAQSNNYPLWIALLCQWRRCVEYGEHYALLVDPDWVEKAEGE